MVTNFLPIGVDAQGVFSKLLTKNNVSVYASQKFKGLKKNFPKSISGAPIIFPTFDSKLRYDLNHWAKLNEVEMNIVVESQDIAVKKIMALDGLGIFPTAKHAVEKLVKSKKIYEIGELKGVHEELYLLSYKRKIPHPLVELLFKEFSV
jgi:LysR family transcriptional activator of nhaA